MNYIPLIIFVLVIVGLIAFAGRARRKQAAAQAELVERIGVGTDVMTTSGLHGTVVAKNDDDTVMLSIAAGIEVRWELAALRDAAALPKQFRSAHRTAADPSDADLDDADTNAAEDGPQAESDSR